MGENERPSNAAWSSSADTLLPFMVASVLPFHGSPPGTEAGAGGGRRAGQGGGDPPVLLKVLESALQFLCSGFIRYLGGQ